LANLGTHSHTLSLNPRDKKNCTSHFTTRKGQGWLIRPIFRLFQNWPNSSSIEWPTIYGNVHPYMAESAVYSSLSNMLKVGKANWKYHVARFGVQISTNVNLVESPELCNVPQWFPSCSLRVPCLQCKITGHSGPIPGLSVALGSHSRPLLGWHKDLLRSRIHPRLPLIGIISYVPMALYSTAVSYLPTYLWSLMLRNLHMFRSMITFALYLI
jgi:hypothetical protein